MHASVCMCVHAYMSVTIGLPAYEDVSYHQTTDVYGYMLYGQLRLQFIESELWEMEVEERKSI